ncbi:MAG TPA: VOC family protein [Gaiella sp.]|jgi:catechol 2,3-dioxygenase-like lactoylglutathione lyase family enzyme
MHVTSFDHVALWTAERDELARLLTEGCGMHVIDRTDAFTLVGGDARRGKVTLFAAEGPRELGVLERIVLRVARLDDVRRRLALAGYQTESEDGSVVVGAPEGVRLAVVEDGGAAEPDLDHVVLTVPDPDATATGLVELGLERDGDRLTVDDRHVVLRAGDAREGERPLLNHLAFLVDSADSVEREARDRGLEVEDVVDAPNTLAVFLRGPDRIRIEYVEHKPGFSLV